MSFQKIKIKEKYGEVLRFEIIIGNEMKIVNFEKDPVSNSYLSLEQIYVQIPVGGTNRSWGISNCNYENRLRISYLRVQKIKHSYYLITKYKILDGFGVIVSWVNGNEGGRLKDLEANDNLIPVPILISESQLC